jgi:pimeloyl-ACP methyl ester carboxylesterase
MLSDSVNSSTIERPATQFYQWQKYRCAYEAYEVWTPTSDVLSSPLLLVPPIGVGLSRRFWDRFIQAWLQAGSPNSIYNPDLLGCGESDMPRVAYTPEDWAAQLAHFVQTVIRQPVIAVVQGASCSIGIEIVQQTGTEWIRGLVLTGPPAWAVMTNAGPNWQQKLVWNLLDSPLGQGFYRYAQRRAFIESFSSRQLFAAANSVDAEWLDRLTSDAKNTASRYAVFSFLAGFWRKNYASAIENLPVPTLVVLGDTASSISRSGKSETPEQRMADYLKHLPHGEGVRIPGRNVLPYEATPALIEVSLPFVQKLKN